MADTNIIQRNIEEYELITRHIKEHQPSSDSVSSTPEHEPGLSRQEKKSLIVLTLLYFIQGIPLGLFADAMQLLLIDAGVSFEGLAIISWITVPFSFKIVSAPFFDTFYNPRIGQRRSYIIPIQYIMSALFLFLSACDMERWIQEKNVYILTAFGMFTVFLAAQQDIAVDGWVLTSFTEKNVHLGASCQSIGQIIGSVLGSNILITLNSVKFCNRFIYSEPHDTPLISISQFLFFISIVILIVNVYVNLFTTEKPATEAQLSRRLLTTSKEQITHSLKNVKNMMNNKNVVGLIAFLFTNRIGFQPLNASFGSIIQKNGFPKELITTLGTLFIPLSIVIPLIVGKYVKQGLEMTWIMRTYYIRFAILIFQYFTVSSFEALGGYNMLTSSLVVMTYLLSFINGSLGFVIISGFFNRVSDSDVGGIYITFMASCSNFGFQLTNSTSLFLIEKVGLDAVVISHAIYAILYAVFARKWIYNFQKIPKEEWKVNIE